MFRALSTRRRSHKGYDQLTDADKHSNTALLPKLSRARSLPAKFLSSTKNLNLVPRPSTNPTEQVKKASKVHPFFSLFESRKRKKATAKPEFSRYMEYVKEGGIWDVKANMPVIYYK
ncbi:uncharacterized protein LOC111365839 [Olea europaea var. sylvestris]|uniref:uncharacterized protein LOC111365839 n=1 Tax=Olea europaea var. sylvestris TaxID=158386 RepID=UPI000C1CEFD6|nr:uncharacterized protein LOC111365839 [Olea europaea var. sylvestris]